MAANTCAWFVIKLNAHYLCVRCVCVFAIAMPNCCGNLMNKRHCLINSIQFADECWKFHLICSTIGKRGKQRHYYRMHAVAPPRISYALAHHAHECHNKRTLFLAAKRQFHYIFSGAARKGTSSALKYHPFPTTFFCCCDTPILITENYYCFFPFYLWLTSSVKWEKWVICIGGISVFASALPGVFHLSAIQMAKTSI